MVHAAVCRTSSCVVNVTHSSFPASCVLRPSTKAQTVSLSPFLLRGLRGDVQFLVSEWKCLEDARKAD